MGHKLGEYEDRIRARLGDLGVLQHLEEEPIEIHLEHAVDQLSSDVPRPATQTFNGDASTFEFDLTADAAAPTWFPSHSVVRRVEYPVGERPPLYLTEGPDWVLKDPEANDGILQFVTVTPATGTDNVSVSYTSRYTMPTSVAADDVIPEAYFNGVCSLAASYMARAKAAEFARQQSISAAGDLFRRDGQGLRDAAKDLEKVYADLVLGRGASDSQGGFGSIGYAVVEQDVLPEALFR